MGGPEVLLVPFLSTLNCNNFLLGFTMSHSATSVTFLDGTVSIDKENNLPCDRYRKSTAGKNILHASFHPRPLIKSIPYSQYLHARHNCSDENKFLKEANLFRTCLLERGYSHTCLKKAFQRASSIPRHDLLFPKRKATRAEITRIITKYSTQHNSQLHYVQILAFIDQCPLSSVDYLQMSIVCG